MDTQDCIDDKIIIPQLKRQLSVFTDDIIDMQPVNPGYYFDAPEIELDRYDYFVLCMSGGKDSIACLEVLLSAGVSPTKIEMWHHLVDGNETEGNFMDWAFMDDYVKKLGLTFGIPVYNSWLKFGFEGEMLKENSTAHNHIIETPDGLMELSRDQSRKGTRRKFPQVSGDLSVRWCSSALKIEPGKRALTHQQRFINKRICFITGERREESSGRAKYFQLEPHSCDTTRAKVLPKSKWSGDTPAYGKVPNPKKPRTVDAWRPVLHYTEEQVWEALKRLNVLPPVPYRAGWSRSSCQTCIFNDDDIWATMKLYWPERLKRLCDYETEFGVTIARDKRTVTERADAGRPMTISDESVLEQIVSKEYTLPILATGSEWQIPAGAFGESQCGAI